MRFELNPDEVSIGDPYRDRPRTRVRQILDIFMGVASEEILSVVTDLEDIFTPKKKKPNPGWRNLEKYNQKCIAARERRAEEAERFAA